MTIEIVGIKTDLMAKAADEIITSPADDHFFFLVAGGDKELNAVHFYVSLDGEMAFEGGTNLDADGKQNVRFDVPEHFRTPNTEYEVMIELYDRADDDPAADAMLLDEQYYILKYT